MTYPSSLGGKPETDKPQSLLLEKIAVLLQKDFAKGSLVDLRGLSKVELVTLFCFLLPLSLRFDTIMPWTWAYTFQYRVHNEVLLLYRDLQFVYFIHLT